MFSIIALACIAVFIILLIICPLTAAIRLDNLHVHMTVSFLFIRIKREYVIRRDRKDFLALWRLRKETEKKVNTLRAVLLGKGKHTEAPLVEVIKIAIQKNRKRTEKSLFEYLYKRIRFNASFFVTMGAGHAYYTALLCGWTAAVGGSLCAAYTRKKKRFSVSVKPEFNRLRFSLHADCIIAMIPANIILGYFIYKIRSRSKKNASD